MSGYTTGSGNNRNGILLQYSSGGALSWSQIIDGPDDGPDELADLHLTGSGDLFVGGYLTRKGNKDFYVGLYGNTGSLRWSDTFNGLANRDDMIQQLTPDGSGNFVVTGPSLGHDNSQSLMTIQYAAYTLVKPQNENVNAPFIENRGQLLNTDGDPVSAQRFYTRSMYPNVYISDASVSYVFAHIDTIPTSTDTMALIDLSFYTTAAERRTVASPLEQQDAHYNFYLGHIPEGRERVPLENKVLHNDLYNNIDALYGQGQDGLFIRLICKPGSDPDDIRMDFDGQTAQSVTSGVLTIETLLEDLYLPQPTAVLISSEGTETAITAWQPAYSIGGDGKIGITTGSYDGSKTLVIKIGRDREDDNPEEVYWSTYYGDTNEDQVIGLETDGLSGDIYFTGTTKSNLFPTLNASQDQLRADRDAFAGKFNYQGERRWVTYYGGAQAADGDNTIFEYGLDIVFKQGNLAGFGETSSGSIYFVGRTDALDFPLLDDGSAYFSDVFWPSPNDGSFRGFIVRLESTIGTLGWATYFGDPGTYNSSNPPSAQESVTIARLNGQGNLCIGGAIQLQDDWTSTFPTTATGMAYSQNYGTGFIAEFDNSDALVWATRLACDGSDIGAHDITFDSQDNLYMVGQSNIFCTNTFPVLADNGEYLQNFPTNGDTDGWIMKFDKDRAMRWSTFFGGTADDQLNSAVVDLDDNLFVVGSTGSTDLPVINSGAGGYYDGSFNGGTSDIFIAKFSSANTQQYTTYFGGSGDEFYAPSTDQGPHDGGCAIYDGENLIFTGPTKSADFPVYNVVPDNIFFHEEINRGLNGTREDAFLAVFGPGMQQRFCTFWGGEQDDRSREIASASVNDQYFVVIGGQSRSNSNIFERRIPLAQETPLSYYQPVYGGGILEGFMSKIRLDQALSSTKELASRGFSVFPNPTGHSVTVSAAFPCDESCVLKVFDVMGRELNVSVHRNDSLTWQIDLSGQPSGHYLIRLSGRDFVASQLIIKI
ncbi:MAG: T9SS type A sorting domain-containing protein [Saprospiraceae bacterium]|nr:T9SS type A sorting domain-containing protein [Saprospiraceae bacterium]